MIVYNTELGLRYLRSEVPYDAEASPPIRDKADRRTSDDRCTQNWARNTGFFLGVKPRLISPWTDASDPTQCPATPSALLTLALQILTMAKTKKSKKKGGKKGAVKSDRLEPNDKKSKNGPISSRTKFKNNFDDGTELRTFPFPPRKVLRKCVALVLGLSAWSSETDACMIFSFFPFVFWFVMQARSSW